jgi:DNA modification methylase
MQCHYRRRLQTPTPQARLQYYPEWLPEWSILAFTQPGDAVLDPFLGSGTTAEVALQHGRNAVGIEMHPPYWEALQRKFRAFGPDPPARTNPTTATARR